jgi:hypothetical protein
MTIPGDGLRGAPLAFSKRFSPVVSKPERRVRFRGKLEMNRTGRHPPAAESEAGGIDARSSEFGTNESDHTRRPHSSCR